MATETGVYYKDPQTGLYIPVDGVLVNGAPPIATTGQSIRQTMTHGKSDGSAMYADPDGIGNLQTRDFNLQGAQSSDQPISNFISGDPSGDFANLNPLEVAMDSTSGLGFNVNIIGGLPKIDANNAVVQSDCAGPYTMKFGAAGQIFDIDTLGYESLSISTSASVNCTISASNSQAYSFGSLAGVSVAIGTAVNGSLGASNNYLFPCLARYIRITVTAAGGSAIAYLRAQPFTLYTSYQTGLTTQPFNLTSIAGNAVAGSIVTGSLVVDGATQPGNAVSNYPVTVGGTDPGNLIRNLRLDTSGRVVIGSESGPDGAANTWTFGAAPPYSNPANVASQAVQDTAQHEGASLTQLIGGLITQMRVLNQQIFMLRTGDTSLDSPDAFENDPFFSTVAN